ncbi:MAG: sigma-70 family RNA polymerase sigma factor [Pseudomonadota bacterium]
MQADLGSVFAMHRAQLQRTAHRILGDKSVAEDVVHDAYLRAVDGARGEAAVQQPLSYAHRMVRNLAIDHHRRGALESRLFEPEEGAAEVAAPAARTPEALAIDRQQLTLVARALAELPERTRRVFDLYRFEGRTQREIGALLGLSAATVNQLIRQVLDHCRQALRQG